MKSMKNEKIKEFLKGLPLMDFSPTGLNNIAKRYGIKPAELTEIIKQCRKESGNG